VSAIFGFLVCAAAIQHQFEFNDCMGTWNAFYVRAAEDSAAMVIAKEFPEGEMEHEGEFIGVKMGDEEFEAPVEKLSAVSRRLGTDVIWLGFQSVVDAFVFHHWQNGELVRSLVYGCMEERVWETVDGSSEAWEREAFFPEDQLKLVLEGAESDEEKEKLRRMWREGEVVSGEFYPMIDARGCGHVIARFYRLPHFGPYK